MNNKDKNIIFQCREHLDKIKELHGMLSEEAKQIKDYDDCEWFLSICGYEQSLSLVERKLVIAMCNNIINSDE